MSGTKKQFSLTRAALSTSGRAKSNFLSVEATVEEIGLIMTGILTEEAMRHATDGLPLFHPADDADKPVPY